MLTRITVIGAVYLTIVCLPAGIFHRPDGHPAFLGGTSLLIVVNVTVDTISADPDRICWRTSMAT